MRVLKYENMFSGFVFLNDCYLVTAILQNSEISAIDFQFGCRNLENVTIIACDVDELNF